MIPPTSGATSATTIGEWPTPSISTTTRWPLWPSTRSNPASSTRRPRPGSWPPTAPDPFSRQNCAPWRAILSRKGSGFRRWPPGSGLLDLTDRERSVFCHRFAHGVGAGGVDHQAEADAEVEGAPHLVDPDPAPALDLGEDVGPIPGPMVNHGPEPVGHRAGQIGRQPAAGDMGRRPHRPGGDGCEDGRGVDHRGLEENLGD